MRLIPAVLFLFPAISGSNAADFEARGPLPIRSQNPIYLQFINLTPTGASVTPRGEAELRIDSTYSNVFEQGFGGNNTVLLDMEILRTALEFSYGFYEDMEAGLEIPFLHFDGGFLDPFIQGYHNLFGFPNSGRETVPNNEFHYYFTRDGAAIYDVPEESFGLSDISLNLKHNVVHEGVLVPAVSWMFYFKMPTGQPSRGLGSGGPDFGFGSVLEKSYKRLHGYLNLGYFVNTGQKYLESYVNNYYFSFMAGGGVSVSKVIDIVLQVSGGTPLLSGTSMSQWDSYPMDLQLGIKAEHKTGKTPDAKTNPAANGGVRAITWQLGFTEDLNPNGPSIDFTVFGSAGMKFGL